MPTIDELMAMADKVMQVKIPMKPKKVRQKKKRGNQSGKGYSYIYVDGKSVLEHRHIMQVHLGRNLQAHEAVYFKNGNKRDMKPDNLILGLKQGVPLSSIICRHCNEPVG